jgi:tetratricopeptide (TPR) repeat protein
MIDADEVFTAPERFAWPDLVGDVYSLLHLHGSTSYWVPKLVANRLPWRYDGVLHEYLVSPGAAAASQVRGPTIVGHYDGGRSQKLTTTQKYARDAETLEKALAAEPGNTRYQYYLARSYRDSEQWGKALVAFRQRATMGGFEEEVYDSLLAIATLQELIGSPPETVLAAYLAAYENRPTRAEPLCSLAHYLRMQERYALAKLFASQAAAIPRPDDILFVDESVYDWRAVDEFAVASYWAGDYEASAEAGRELLAGERVPEADRVRVKANLDFAEAKLAER